MDSLAILISIASDLTSALSSENRHRRLLGALRRVIPYDAAALLRLEGDQLVPIVSEGLTADAMGRRFPPREHPRLRIICDSERPVFFRGDSELPDPFDGLLNTGPAEFSRVHSCLGCPLRIHDELIGVLTADAALPGAFDGIDPDFLGAVAALAAIELKTTQLIEGLERGAERQGLIVQDLMRDLQLRQGSEMIGTSSQMQRLRRDIDLVAGSEFSVLITGETGVGKELVARAVHAGSGRRTAPMLYVNCAALPETLVDSELFGHVRGAFTGAVSDRAGKFEVAGGGTLFLDEIGELPLQVQPKLLRATQEGEIQRVGSDRVIKADFRLIAATNRDLEQEVKDGRFRADLFHRLCVFPLHVPPLRERAEDLPLLAGFFCDVMRRKLGLGPIRIKPEVMDSLRSYSWPGNVRELENVLSRATLKAAAQIPRGQPVLISTCCLEPDISGPWQPKEEKMPPEETSSDDTGRHLKEATREFQRGLIRRVLAEQGGNWAAAARSLGMHRSNFHHLAERLGLK